MRVDDGNAKEDGDGDDDEVVETRGVNCERIPPSSEIEVSKC